MRQCKYTFCCESFKNGAQPGMMGKKYYLHISKFYLVTKILEMSEILTLSAQLWSTRFSLYVWTFLGEVTWGGQEETSHNMTCVCYQITGNVGHHYHVLTTGQWLAMERSRCWSHGHPPAPLSSGTGHWSPCSHELTCAQWCHMVTPQHQPHNGDI